VVDRPLHIAVDGRELVGRATGAGTYVREVIRAWLADPGFPHRLTIFAASGPPPALAAALAGRAAWQIVPGATSGTWWEQVPFPRAIARAGADVLFAGAYTAPLLTACPTVLAVHDVSYFAHPEWFHWREGLRRRWVTRQAARRASHVITLSEFSADEITRWLGLPRDRITLAPPGAPDASLPASTGADPVVLFVGSLFNRRLIPELIDGFALAARLVPSARLILVGDNRTRPAVDPAQVAARAGVADRVTWRAYVDDTELARLYGSARVFAFLSTYEGFGMTPLEAIARGVPAVVLDTPVAREVYGDGARLVGPDPASIGAALATLLADASAHAALVGAGRARLQAYSWPRTAAIVRAALEQASATR
jgi:glycosyltransferase involved in cell wall biosynthesis